MDSTPAIGIDLGTTNSCVAVMRHGQVEIIANEQGYFVTPSYVTFNEIESHVGDVAKKDAAQNAANTVFDVKRLIGNKYEDPVIQTLMRNWPFAVLNKGGHPYILVTYRKQQKTYAPEQISGMVLAKMKRVAESYLNAQVKDAVITVPAYFNNAQRQATVDAGRIAGLNVLKIINEPTAAALAFGHKRRDIFDVNMNVMVYDLGGGTFDVSIVNVHQDKVVVLATNGDTHLGGEDFDCRLLDFCVGEFTRKHSLNIRSSARALRRLRTACEMAKRELSTATSTKIVVDAIMQHIDFSINITRARFEEMNIAQFRKTLEPVRKALDDAKLARADIDRIVLVGGSTRIPRIQKLLEEFFDGKPLEKSIHPEEAVAYGAAVSAAILKGNHSADIFGSLLTDITSLSLGIGSMAHHTEMFVIIPRNTPLPCEMTVTRTTIQDNQQHFLFQIRQGESRYAYTNFLLGEFSLNGIRPASKGAVIVRITFSIDANGILTVKAVDAESGSSNGITIHDVTRHLDKERIEAMIQEATVARREEDARRSVIRAREELEAKCYAVKLALEEAKCESVPAKTAIIQKCDDALNLLDADAYDIASPYEQRHAEIVDLLQGLSI